MRKPKTVAFWLGRLPHWEVEDGRYFVTIHLAGAIPAEGRTRLRTLSEQVRRIPAKGSPAWLHLQRLTFGEIERWLDRAERCASLQRQDIAEMVVEAVTHRHELGIWQMFEFVVMPTHVHLFFELRRQGLKETLDDFKRWTGHRAVGLLKSASARFRQREWFDHWSRSDQEDERIVRYIRENPVKAGLVVASSLWRYAGRAL
jgi:REP element-mobilizing transposase RayT